MKDNNVFKTVLVVPPDRVISPRPPLSLMYIAAYLEQEGEDVDIIDLKLPKRENNTIKLIVDEIKKRNPKIIGTSAFSTDLKDVLELSTLIKNEMKDITIIIGGIHASLYPKDFIFKKSPIDIAVIGEGEETFNEIIKAKRFDKDIKDIKGIVYLKNGKLIETEKRVLMNMNKMPMPAFNKVDMKFYLKPTLYAVRGVPLSAFYIFSSRGCPFRCTFCSNSAIYGRNIRYREYKKVIDEVEMLVKTYKADGFYIYDDTFTFYRQYVINFCEEMIKRKIKAVWGCQTRVDKVDLELLKIMKKAGCIQVDFGVESGSQKQLDIIQKDTTTEKVLEAFDACKKVGIRQFANFMINIPDETEEDIAYLKEFVGKIKPNVVVFNVLSPLPGSPLYDQMENKGDADKFMKVSFRQGQDAHDFLYENVNFTKHKRHFKEVLKELYEEFPSAQGFSLKLNRNYFKQVSRELSFLKDLNYITKMLSSKNKSDYMKFILNPTLKYNPH